MSEHSQHALMLLGFILALGYILKRFFTVHGLPPVPPVYNSLAQPKPPYHT